MSESKFSELDIKGKYQTRWMGKDELTYRIIGCAMKVHNMMGPGFQEVLYQRCLALELAHAGLVFHREKEQTVYY